MGMGTGMRGQEGDMGTGMGMWGQGQGHGDRDGDTGTGMQGQGGTGTGMGTRGQKRTWGDRDMEGDRDVEEDKDEYAGTEVLGCESGGDMGGTGSWRQEEGGTGTGMGTPGQKRPWAGQTQGQGCGDRTRMGMWG